jgi:hypothetical protein
MNLATKLASRLLPLCLLATLAALVSACVAGVGSPMASVPFDTAGRCAGYCSKMGMNLGAVVVMANNVGCVCTPMGRGGGTASLESVEGGAAGAGLVTILAQEQQRQAAASAAQHH